MSSSEPFVIIFGGRSTEHDASVHSYLQIVRDVVDSPVLHDGLKMVFFIDCLGNPFAFKSGAFPRCKEDLCDGQPLSRASLCAELAESRNFVFSLLHGNEGEDGAWQGLAEVLDLKGNFGETFVSAVSMNKWAQALLAAEIVGPALSKPRTWRVGPESTRDDLDHIAARLEGKRALIKPNRMGASHFVSVLDTPTCKGIEEAAAIIFPFDAEVLVQELIVGTEYTCGCLHDGNCFIPLPVLSVRAPSGVLGHEEKHLRGDLDIALHHEGPFVSKLRGFSERIFRAIGFHSMCRFDYIVDADGAVYFLEANSLPGLMDGSAYTMMLREVGRTRAAVVEAAMSFERRRQVRSKCLRYQIRH